MCRQNIFNTYHGYQTCFIHPKCPNLSSNFVTATSKRPKTTRRFQMNVAKNWALTIMFIALAFAHFSSKLLLNEQMIFPVKKTLNNAGHIDAKLIDFSEICQKKSSEIGCFLLIVSWRSFPPKFPVKSADFSKNLPLKIL